MFESKLIWMYFQSNSIPLAPTHSGRHLRSHIRTQPVKHNDYMFTLILLFSPSEKVLLLTSTSQVLQSPSPWRPPWSCTLLYQHYETWRDGGPTGQPGPLLPSWIPGKTNTFFLLSITGKIRVDIPSMLMLLLCFNTHPYKVINPCSSFPRGEKCGQEQHLKPKKISKSSYTLFNGHHTH